MKERQGLYIVVLACLLANAAGLPRQPPAMATARKSPAASLDHRPLASKRGPPAPSLSLKGGGPGSTVPQSVYTLAAFLMGGMILTLPYGFRCAGLGLGFLVLSLVAAMNGYTNWLLLKMSSAAGVDSYEGLCSKILGQRWREVYQWSNGLLLFGCSCACLATAKDLLWLVVKSTEQTALFANSPTVLMACIVAGFCVPMSMSSNMSALNDFSMLGLYLNFLMSALIIKDSVAAGLPAASQPLATSSFETLKAFPIFSFAFFLTPALFPVYQELDSKLKHRMTEVLKYTLGAAMFVYTVFGGFGYLHHGMLTEGNVIDNMDPKSWQTLLIALGNGATCAACIPLINVPLIDTVNELATSGREARSEGARRVVQSVALHAVALGLVTAVPNIEHITEITGATFVTIVCYLIPCFMFLRMSAAGGKHAKGLKPNDLSVIPGSLAVHRNLAKLILVAGVAVSVVSLSVIIPEVMGHS